MFPNMMIRVESYEFDDGGGGRDIVFSLEDDFFLVVCSRRYILGLHHYKRMGG